MEWIATFTPEAELGARVVVDTSGTELCRRADAERLDAWMRRPDTAG